MPDRGGQGQEALQDADQDTFGGVSAVAFEVELVLAGVEDRFDDLAEWFEEPLVIAFRFALAGRAEQVQPDAGQGGLEVVSVVVLVADYLELDN